jgi:hypothetical protein
MKEAGTKLEAIKQALLRSTVGDLRLDHEVRALLERLRDLQQRLDTPSGRWTMGYTGPVTLSRRLEVVVNGVQWSTYGPTATHRENFAMADKGVAELVRDLGELREELAALEGRLEAAGVPWTPGRAPSTGGG